MSGNIVARRYAKALFAVGMKQGDAELEAYGKQLAGLAGALAESPVALRFFKKPVISVEEKKAVSSRYGCAGLTQTMVNFACCLPTRTAFFLPEIAEDFGAMLVKRKRQSFRQARHAARFPDTGRWN